MKLYDGSYDCCYVCGWDYTKAHRVDQEHRHGISSPLAHWIEVSRLYAEELERKIQKLKEKQ